MLKSNIHLRYNLLFLAILTVLTGVLAGCASKLSGDEAVNSEPTVWFVNIPPDGSSTSINPIVNWVGQDRDGQVDSYRFLVVTEPDIASALGLPVPDPGVGMQPADVQKYVDSLLSISPDSIWTYLFVSPAEGNPQTSNVIPLKADLQSPVNIFVPQFVFVQAFDELGSGSAIAFRRFLRNDNPPNTAVRGFNPTVPFINSVLPGSGVTGIRFSWEASDITDYPTDPPPFEFEWKIYGPYYDSILTEIENRFRHQVFVTNDARIFKFNLPPDLNGLPTHFVVCDTSFPGGVETISCDTILVDTITSSNVYGNIDTLFEVTDSAFVNDQIKYNLVADSSDNGSGGTWVSSTTDSMFNIFRDFPSDTTRQMKFLLIIRARDDALVPDLTPSFIPFEVVDPRFERDILVLDFAKGSNSIRVNSNASQNYWDSTLQDWIATRSETGLSYDRTVDFLHWNTYKVSPSTLGILMSHKILILMNDGLKTSPWADESSDERNHILVAMRSGVNAWVNMRLPMGDCGSITCGGYSWDGPPTFNLNSPSYEFFFGVDSYTYSGWGFYSFSDPRVDIQDFVGALTMDSSLWPELVIDSSRLHSLYNWGGGARLRWNANLPALPGVGWAVRTFDTEVMYLYNSLYGQEHPLGADHSYHGRPVVHRLNRGVFRSVHSLFTPIALEQSSAQKYNKNILDWLYDGSAYRPGAAKSTKSEAFTKGVVTKEEIGQAYWKAYWEADGNTERFYQLLNGN